MGEKDNILEFVTHELDRYGIKLNIFQHFIFNLKLRDLVVIKYSLGVIENELSRFLRTRTSVFPRLNLSLLSQSHFGLGNALSTSMITSMFPQVTFLRALLH